MVQAKRKKKRQFREIVNSLTNWPVSITSRLLQSLTVRQKLLIRFITPLCISSDKPFSSNVEFSACR